MSGLRVLCDGRLEGREKDETMNQRMIGAIGALMFTGLTATVAHADSKVSPLDRTFAVTVSQANNAEVMTSRLAMQKSGSKKVRTIAMMLIEQHGKAEQALKQVAMAEKIRLPEGTDAEHRAAYRKLQRLSGAAFDRTFVANNVADHYKAIALFNKELNGGNDTQVRSFATTYLPDNETHTQMITALASNYKIPTATKNAGRSASIMRRNRMGSSSSAEMSMHK